MVIAEADYRIGLFYEKSEGVRGSMPDAVFWYERAAAGDQVEAQYKLGLIYRYGVTAQLGPTAYETWRRSSEKRLGNKASTVHALVFPTAPASPETRRRRSAGYPKRPQPARLRPRSYSGIC